MVRCYYCVLHKSKGAAHTCSKCDTKIIYGVMQEPFIECCEYFTMTESAKQRRAFLKKINSLLIDDRGRGGKKK